MKYFFYSLFSFFIISACASGKIDGGEITKSVKDFGAKGDGKTNDQLAFEKAAVFFNARGGNGKLIIPKGIYIVGKQEPYAVNKSRAFAGSDVLNFIKCNNLVLEATGAKLKFTDSLRFGAFDPLTGASFFTSASIFTKYSFSTDIGYGIYLKDCENISITGIEIDGNQQGMILGGKFGDHGFQLGHDGIFIEDCKKVTINKVHIHHMGRDGIQIANKTPQNWATPDQKITILNSVFEYNGRQGLSWIGGSGLKVVNSKFNRTGRGRFVTAPAAGMDIEAEIGIIQNGHFENCEFFDNDACGMVADSGESRNMWFNNCEFWGTTSWSMWTTKPNYNFENCRFTGSIVQGYDSPTHEDATKFIKCTFEEKNYNGKPPYGNFLVEINFKKRMLFEKCTFISLTKKIWWFDGSSSWAMDERMRMKDATIIAKMTNLPDGDYISVKHTLMESGSTYELYYPKSKKYTEVGESHIDAGGNKLVWKNQ